MISISAWMKRRYLCRYIDGIKCFTPVGSPSKRGKLRRPYSESLHDESKVKALTEEQESAISKILPYVNNEQHKAFLIHGVTSSGKTEIYLRVIEECISNGKNAIMLVPEISLTTQTIERFISRFGADQIAVLHSRLSKGERYDEWMRIKNNQVRIVIGARSGIFAPLTNIGAIVLDEEHESTYKSDMTPKYETAEVAIQRGKWNKAVVLFGSATPSLVSNYRAEKGYYEKLVLKERYNKAPLPTVEIIDMRDELKNGNKSIFSVSLYQEMKKNLDDKRQIILFLNRRGYSTFISCRSCGYVMECKECGISLTYHKERNRALCHYCGYWEGIPELCPQCNKRYLKHFGTGTEKVEEFTKEIFPEFNVERLDLDTTRLKGSTDKILNRFKKGKTNILIGTQLVAKGLDFANVGLVGIISADISLNIPDFRSAERTFQLITQAAGRAGRGDNPGKVIIQSYSPKHYSIQTASKHDYDSFYKTEKQVRNYLEYPPYTDLIQIVISSLDDQIALTQSKGFVKEFIESVGKQEMQYVLGPQPAPINKVNGHYRYQLLIKCQPQKRRIYSKVLNELKLSITTNRKARCLISIDFNPYSFI
jgi:primosomal protein N' (replication factor Y)